MMTQSNAEPSVTKKYSLTRAMDPEMLFLNLYGRAVLIETCQQANYRQKCPKMLTKLWLYMVSRCKQPIVEPWLWDLLLETTH